MSKPNWPCYTDEEIQAVSNVLCSGQVNYWTGQEGRSFEKEFSSYVGTSHAIAVSNGTVAIELCLRALGIGSGDEVIVTSRTFLASASSIVICGATPVFADVDPISQNISLDTIKEKISSKTKAIICVHLAGWPCDMPEIMTYAQKNNLYVVEDCAQAHGASIDGKKVGSWGHMAAFSFCQDKIMSTGGEGGMIITNDEVLWKKAWSYKDHGKSYDAVYNKKHPPGFRWLHESFGSNYRMTEMQAAIGRIQLKNLDESVAVRIKNARMYSDFFSTYEFISIHIPPKNIVHSYYKYYCFIKAGYEDRINRDKILQEINARGVRCFVGSCSEVYNEKCFDYIEDVRPKYSLKSSQYLFKHSLMFEVDPTISSKDIENNLEILKPIFDSVTESIVI